MRIRAYFCTNPNKLHREPPAETYEDFAGETSEECENKALEYAKKHKYEFTGWDEYIDPDDKIWLSIGGK